MTSKPKYVEDFVDRHGARRVYFRRNKGPRTLLPHDIGSPEFWQAYDRAYKAEFAMKADEIINKQNDFEHLTNWRLDNGQEARFALRIVCSKCSARDAIAMPRGFAYTCPQALADKTFRNKGWMIHDGRKHDVCPTCLQRQRDDRAKRRLAAEPRATLGDVMPSNIIALAQKSGDSIMPAIVADPPPEMTREDRRIIFAKLNDVYIDEKVGYDKTWSDKAVADSLNCPRAWVEKVREENFGPEASNEEAREIVEEGRKLLDETERLASALREKAREMLHVASAASTQLSNLETRLKSVEKLFR